MKILITGPEGFIAKSVFAAALTQGWEAEPWIGSPIPGCGDLRWDRILPPSGAYCRRHNIDCVVHLGADSDTRSPNPELQLLRNLTYTALLHLASAYEKIPRVIASSAAVYGPASAYSVSKQCAEQTCRGIHLRFFNVYGPGEEHKGDRASVLTQALMAERHHMLGPLDVEEPANLPWGLFDDDPPPMRDFIRVEDAASAVLRAVELAVASPTNTSVFDVGTGEARTFQEMLDLAGIAHRPIKNPYLPETYQCHTRADPAKFLPGWTPQWTFEGGVLDYAKRFRESYHQTGPSPANRKDV